MVGAGCQAASRKGAEPLVGPRRAKMAAAGRGGALDVAAAGLWLGLRDAARRCCRSALEGARRVSAAAPQGRLLPAASALGSGGDRRGQEGGGPRYGVAPRCLRGGAGGGWGRAARFVLGGGGGGEQEGGREHARVSAPPCCAPRLS